MAKYKSITFSNIRGSIGGLTFSANSSGSMLRQSNIPRDPKTPIQTESRNIFQQVAQNWRSLTSAEQATWKTLALLLPQLDKVGNTVYLTAFQLFQKHNLILMLHGFPGIVDTPDIALNTFPSLTGWNCNIVTTFGLQDIKLNITAPLSASQIGVIETTGVVSNGINYPKSFKTITQINNTFVSGASIKEAYLIKFGAMVDSGQKVFFRFSIFETVGGFASSKVISSAIGTA